MQENQLHKRNKMDYFNYKDGVLHAEEIAVPKIAAAVGTPFYLYSTATLKRHYQVFCEGVSGLDTLVCFAVKANSNCAVLATLQQEGAGADVVSEGEIRRAQKAGIAADKIVFSGVGKTKWEMAYALEAGIFQFNVESEPELEALSDVAVSKGRNAPIAIRINPDVDAKTHAKISTGKKDNKFGVSLDTAHRLYQKAAAMEGLSVQGVSMHIGSQLTTLEPFNDAYIRAAEFVKQLRSEGHPIDVLDLGGGLGVPYDREFVPPSPLEYGQIVRNTVGDLGCKLVFEPGRLIVGNAGLLVSQVIYEKQGAERRFVIVDTAMNDLMRPAMYEAHHDIVTINESDAATTRADVVGPVCETGDTFAEQRPLPPLQSGDLIAFRTAGAYGAVMSGTYNSRCLIPEVLVSGTNHAIIRKRPSYDELLAQDIIPDWL